MKKVLLMIVGFMLSVCLSYADSSPWCETKIGHFGKADFGDAQSHVDLTVKAGETVNTLVVSIKPSADNPKQLSYLWINCVNGAFSGANPVEVGNGDGSGDFPVLTAEIPLVESATEAIFEMQWAHSGWPGRWCMGDGESDGCKSITVDVTATCGEPEPPSPEVGPQEAPIPPTYPENQVKAVYSTSYAADCGFGDWGSGTTYTQDTYGKKFVTTALGYFGLIDFALNCSKMEGLKMAVYSDASFSMGIVPIHGGPEVCVTKDVVAGQWNYINIALSEFAGVTDWSNVFQIKIDNVPSQTFWLNDIYFYTTKAPQEDEDAPENFSAEVTGVSYGSVTIKAYAEDASGEIIYTVKESGAIIATANGVSGIDKVFTVTGLESGKDYSLLVLASDPSGNVADGISLDVTTLATPDSPEAPTYDEEDVISIFSDSYTAATTFNIGSWGQSTSAELVKLSDGGNAYHLSNANYLGWELNQTLDVTDMTNVRFDVYPLSGTSIEFTPIWGNPGEKLIITNGLVENEWNTVDISLDEFTGIVTDNVYQVKWANMPTEMFLTNVLFYNDTTTDGNAPAEEAPAVAKYFNQDWQLRIVGADNVIRNIMGVEVAK